MKKAIPEGMAPFAPHTLSGFLREPMPASEGFAFNWGPYFDGMHSRNPDGLDGGAGPHAEHTQSGKIFQPLQLAAAIYLDLPEIGGIPRFFLLFICCTRNRARQVAFTPSWPNLRRLDWPCSAPTLHVPIDVEQQEMGMDKDRIAGTAKQAKGAAKEAVGKMTGDTKLKAEGKAEKTAGKVQNTAGSVKDALRDK
jgi:uncharacterized protein YjbJ (UPF0337 family)